MALSIAKNEGKTGPGAEGRTPAPNFQSQEPVIKETSVSSLSSTAANNFHSKPATIDFGRNFMPS
jgi:hypothetical protein